ncbi:uncharacterized protein LOC129295879 isoform X1 [Prosopis cineraria]|uniref:uncharacterized protein LOC129295879 isoform X1 n=2 Tax=Prosopis cineraria TaxID=364024 RepID=UPI0024101D71|nr:uncharacterized protein LOC129295879 isoform X1 [Prosopis cineraria]XP_054790454.1 uncharacterized protein LOC129295879 isoform X1 [Prosopis cineraria]XP_054790462.1 uncharacterized protein LOC129295879 isoform X1 [Prosopis cineraria]XP_054790470.1 uncharacterized protein LOC129295879 isoform X1 [Prosopis cineraria]XP_054790478.1 uncharacterized protein LOC129295879 isoform X1 [Prosopis cineraria]
MSGNSRFDISAASPEELVFKGTVPYGQRGNLTSGSLERSGSFREGNEGRMFISGASMFRGNCTSAWDLPPLSQCLMLDPINMGDQKHIRSGELKKALGISCGSTLEDCSFGASNLKPSSPVATEDLKRFKASVVEASVKARGRSKRLDESLHKLNKYCEALNSKKQLRNEMLPNERLGGLNLLKMGGQIHRNTSELVNQRLEDRSKNVTLNKRFRTPIAEIRAEGQNNILRQPLVAGKDRDTLRDGGEDCDFVEEKIRKLPAGGETWDRKMKRKRSMGTSFARSSDGEGELKRVMHLKITNESGLQSSDTQGLRSGSSGNNSKLDLSSLPAGSNGYATAKNEQEKVQRDSIDGSNKERVILRGNKFNVRDNNYIGGGYPLTKGKASRASRTGPLVAANSSIASRSSEALDSWERPSKVNKHQSVCGNMTRKRSLPTGSSPPSMAQWVGQRPQKISRTRRVNVVSPVLNTDDVQMPLECCSPSDVSTRMTSAATNGSLFSKGAANSSQQVRVKHENGSLPPMLSESEELDAAESKLKEKGLESSEIDEKAANNSQNTSSSVLVLATRKNKTPSKEEIGDGLRRQGRNNRGSSILRTSFSPSKEKLETTTLAKPHKSTKPISEKNGSKSGRPPLKKSSDRKCITRLGHPSTGDSPDFSGESDDDREELLEAANFASNSSYAGCSSSFWKKLEPIFAPVNLASVDYLKQLVKSMEEDHGLSQTFSLTNDVSDGLLLKNNSLLQCQKEKSISIQMNSKEISSMIDMDGQHLDSAFLHKQADSGENKDAPLYQRVLAAIVLEDQVDETDDSLDIEHKSLIGAEFESHSVSSPQVRTQCASDVSYCNGNITFTNGLNIHEQELDDVLQVHQGLLHSDTALFPKLSKNGCGGLLAANLDSSHSLSFNCQFEKMSLDDKILLELQSIGLYPEAVPDLTDGDSEPIDQDIIHLQKCLDQQVCKKREDLMKLIQEMEKVREMEQRALEPVAMEKLVELAYKKKLATRGSSAARNGLPKVSKQVALAFMKRTLARCRKFEDAGRSCFMDPALKDILFAVPAHDNYAGSVAAINLPQSQNCEGEAVLSGFIPFREQYGLDNDQIGTSPVGVFENLNQLSDHDFARTGPILNRGKKKELLLDDVGATASLRSAPILGSSFMGGAKGKRSERERDKDPSGRNPVAKTGRLSAGCSRGERKTKAKPKQKTAQLSASVNGSLGKLPENTDSENQFASGSGEVNDNGNARKCKIESVSHGHTSNNLSMEPGANIDFTSLHEFDSIELGVDNELNEHQDLGSWLNIEEENLQDHDAVGLDIPMDDLSELNMF